MDYEYSTELPPGFVPHSAPSASNLVGSQISETHTSVVYAVDGDTDRAVDEITASMIDDGWSEVGDTPGMRRGGFQTKVNYKNRQLCHSEGPTIVNISARDSAQMSMVTLSVNNRFGASTCEALADRNRYAFRHFSMPNELPVLKIPDGVNSTSQGSAGGGGDYATRVSVSTDMSRQSLVTILNDQIRDQGWTFDGSWTGGRTSGSTWFKETADGDPLIGMLHAYGMSGRDYSLIFSIRLDDAASRSGARSTAIRFE